MLTDPEILTRPLLVVAANLVAEDGRHLLHRRPLDKQHGGLWEFPGGKVEEGEIPSRALVRELAEELGVSVQVGDLTPLSFAEHPAESLHQAMVLLLYRCSRWVGEPSAMEGGGISWFSRSQMDALMMPPLDRELLAVIAGNPPD